MRCTLAPVTMLVPLLISSVPWPTESDSAMLPAWLAAQASLIETPDTEVITLWVMFGAADGSTTARSLAVTATGAVIMLMPTLLAAETPP